MSSPVSSAAPPTLRFTRRACCVALVALVLLAATFVLSQDSARAQANTSSDSITVYEEALAAGFGNWSWATVDMASTAEIFEGQTSISVDYGAWEGLYLGRSEPLALPLHGSVDFAIRGTAGGAHQPVLLALLDPNQQPGPAAEITVSPGEWTSISVPLSELGSPSRIGGIWWQNGSGSTQPTIHIDSVRIVTGEAPPPEPGPALSVELGAASITRTVTDPASGRTDNQTVQFPHAINDDVYGLNFAAPTLLEDVDPGVNRWGGNAVERYNHTIGTSNLGHDWYFFSSPDTIGGDDNFVRANDAAGTDTLLTVPLAGWVARDRAPRCGYPVNDTFGAANNAAPMDDSTAHWLDGNVVCGNGNRNGETVAGDPTLTSTEAGPDFIEGWVQELVATHGPASAGGVQSYALGNEPGLWHVTHSDIVDTPMGRDDIIDRNIAAAHAVKNADGSAAVVGPVLWGGYSYYVTSEELDAGQRPGDVPTFVGDYLSAMNTASANAGHRLVDSLAVNFYDDRVFWGGTDELRLESTRSLWDPTYAPSDWWVIRDFVFEGHAVIPRMQSLIDTNYPGTGLAITEYNFGALDTLAGGLAQADALGIFGREGLDAAMLWDPFNEQLSAPLAEFTNRPAMWAFQLFRNYDGAGSRFGDVALLAESGDQDVVSIYAAQRSQDDALTIMMINKSVVDQESTLSIPGLALSEAVGYRYSGRDLNAIEELGDQTFSADNSITLPARSATLFVIAATTAPTATPVPTATTAPTATAAPTATPVPTATTAPTATAAPTATPVPTATAAPTATPTTPPRATPNPNPTPKPTATPTATAPPIPTTPPVSSGVCVPGVPAGALPGQPAFVGCGPLTTGAGTSMAGPNTWVDDFNHGLSLADFTGTSYRVYEDLGIEGSVHWRHNNHWMVDLALDPAAGITGGALLSPNQTFQFDNGTLVIEADVAAGMADNGANAWPEIVVSTASAPTSPRWGGLYAYDNFQGAWALGCRLQTDTAITCSLIDDTNTDGRGGTRVWEMSFFQHVGTDVFGGGSFVDGGTHFRSCPSGTSDAGCRDRFRLELTETSLTLYVNGLLYFEQTGVPALPAALVDGELSVFFGSMVSRHPADSLRFHWDRVAVNPGAELTVSPTFN